MSIKQNITSLQNLLEAVNSLPEAGGEQATPEISVNSSTGLITATAGTKSSTYQLAFQAAKTITPGTASQIAVSSGYYTGGNVTVAGDANLVAENIKSGISIFGVSGTLEEGGSGEAVEWSENEDAVISGTISGAYINDRVNKIASYRFYMCQQLTEVRFPQATSVGLSAFAGCVKLSSASMPEVVNIQSFAFASCTLTEASFPKVSYLGASAFIYNPIINANFPNLSIINYGTFSWCESLINAYFPIVNQISSWAFGYCTSLGTINCPMVSIVKSNAFAYCSKLASMDFKSIKNIYDSAFKSCYNLSSIILGASTVCTLSNSNAFASTPYAGYSSYFSGTPYIYVPSSLLTSYKTATNWTYYSSYFSGI